MQARRLSRAICAAVLATTSLCSLAASTVPSWQITSLDSYNCSPVDTLVEANINVPTGVPNSTNYEIYDGSTLLYRAAGYGPYFGVGTSTYGIAGSSTVAANTVVSGVIYTFPMNTVPSAPYTPDKYSYRSQVDFNCTTGEVLRISNTVGGTVATPVPVLGTPLLVALSLLVLGTGFTLRRAITARAPR